MELARKRNLASSAKATWSHKRPTVAQQTVRAEARQSEWAEIVRLHRARALILIAALGLLALEVLIMAILLIEKTPFIVVSVGLLIGYLGVVRLLLRPLPDPEEKEAQGDRDE